MKFSHFCNKYTFELEENKKLADSFKKLIKEHFSSLNQQKQPDPAPKVAISLYQSQDLNQNEETDGFLSKRTKSVSGAEKVIKLILILQDNSFKAYGILILQQAEAGTGMVNTGHLENFLVKDQGSKMDQLLVKATECVAR